jgi:hypothetical protein
LKLEKKILCKFDFRLSTSDFFQDSFSYEFKI